MQTWFSVGRGTVFQTMISGDSGKLNTKCYISPESAKSEFSVSGIRFCTESSMFQLQPVFRLLCFHGEMYTFTVADEIATWSNEFSSFQDISSRFQGDLMVL